MWCEVKISCHSAVILQMSVYLPRWSPPRPDFPHTVCGPHLRHSTADLLSSFVINEHSKTAPNAPKYSHRRYRTSCKYSLVLFFLSPPLCDYYSPYFNVDCNNATQLKTLIKQNVRNLHSYICVWTKLNSRIFIARGNNHISQG